MAATVKDGLGNPLDPGEARVIELKDYPVPDGIVVPNLMPYQLRAFNGDPYLAAEVLRLKEVHGLTNAIETGTCLGSTTLWLVENFQRVGTCEVNEDYAKIAQARLSSKRNLEVILGASVEVIAKFLVDGAFDNPTFVFLDAHWGPNCPLLDELECLTVAKVKPCILIHDFFVPDHPDFGFDSMPDGRPFDLELVRDHLDRIYGEGGWRHNYPTQVAGARRGWISIEPA